MKKIIFLVGFMGSGKSTIGILLSEYLGWEFVDLDKVIEEKEGMKIKDIFAVKGEDYFRNLEIKTLKDILSKEKVVVATGGGLGARREAMEIMKANGFVVWLDISFEEFMKRCGKDPNRPLLKKGRGELEKLFNERRKVYREADLRVDGGQSPYFIVKSIIDKLPWKG